MKKEIPVIGKTYNYFDDGKIKESRRSQVVVMDVIPFGELPTHSRADGLGFRSQHSE